MEERESPALTQLQEALWVRSHHIWGTAGMAINSIAVREAFLQGRCNS